MLSNRHLALEKYQNQMLYNAAQSRVESSNETALRSADKDSSYAPWSDLYPRDVVSRESHALGGRLTESLIDTLPARFVSDPGFDFGVKESGIDLVAELDRQDSAKRARFDTMVTELLGNFGAHSRNLVRGVLKSAAAK